MNPTIARLEELEKAHAQAQDECKNKPTHAKYQKRDGIAHVIMIERDAAFDALLAVAKASYLLRSESKQNNPSPDYGLAHMYGLDLDKALAALAAVKKGPKRG